jgi:hypothetical protein
VIDCREVVERYLNRVEADLQCTVLEDNRILIDTPHVHRDGDVVQLVLESAPGGLIRLTDEGLTAARLEMHGIDIGSRKAASEARSIVRAFNVDLDGETLQVQGTPANSPDMLIRLVGAMRGLESLSALRRDRGVRRFGAQVITYLNSQFDDVVERPQKAGRSGHLYRLTASVPRGDSEVLVQAAAGNTADAQQRSLEHALRVFFDINGEMARRDKLVLVSSSDERPWRSADLQLLGEVAYVGSWGERDRARAFLDGTEIPDDPLLASWQPTIG